MQKLIESMHPEAERRLKEAAIRYYKKEEARKFEKLRMWFRDRNHSPYHAEMARVLIGSIRTIRQNIIVITPENRKEV